MESAEDLLAKIRNRHAESSALCDTSVQGPADTATFVKIRRKRSIEQSSDSQADSQDERVSQEALIGPEGVIGLAG